MELKNIIATYGSFTVTEEVNCYVVWYTNYGVRGHEVFPFGDASTKDQAYQNANACAKHKHQEYGDSQ